MSNIAVSEIQNTASLLKKDDLLLVSTHNNNGSYTSAKATFNSIVKPSIVYVSPEHQTQYILNYNGNPSNINLQDSEVRNANNKLISFRSNALEIPADFVTFGGYLQIIYDGNTDVPIYGPNIYINLVSNNGNSRLLYRNTYYPGAIENNNFVDKTGYDQAGGFGIYYFIPYVSIAKEDGNYVEIRSTNISTNSMIYLTMYY